MTRAEFMAGIERVEAALQGAFDPKFVGYLWEYYRRHDAEEWANICATLCQSTKSARNLVFHDFLQVGITMRGRAHDRRKQEQNREARSRDIRKLDVIGMVEDMAKKTGNPYYSRLAERLQKREGDAGGGPY